MLTSHLFGSNKKTKTFCTFWHRAFFRAFCPFIIFALCSLDFGFSTPLTKFISLLKRNLFYMINEKDEVVTNRKNTVFLFQQDKHEQATESPPPRFPLSLPLLILLLLFLLLPLLLLQHQNLLDSSQALQLCGHPMSTVYTPTSCLRQ